MRRSEKMSINTKCQVFTPKKNAQDLLNAVGYNDNLFGKKVAENSCGDGSILAEIVERYIVDALKHNHTIDEIKVGLEQDVWGAEIDKSHITNCKIRLDGVAGSFGLSAVSWNIFEGDFLRENIVSRFDFVIGNPPYITYKELNLEDRIFVRESFETCSKGKFDYYYAFIEASLKSLKSTGKLAYLIPSNIFKNQFALDLRKYILPFLTDIYDYSNQKLFTGKLTASAIIVCDISRNSPSFEYHNLIKNKTSIIDKDSLNEKWMFQKSEEEVTAAQFFRFGDYFHAASSIATLSNEVYIIADFVDDGEYIQVNGKKIEKALLRNAVSPRSLNYEKKEYVIFPYYYSADGLQRYNEDEFCKKFPFAANYLRQFEKKLNERKSDKGINWFEYGRSQALMHLNQPKVLISTLVTGKVKVKMLGKDTIPTSGIYIVKKESQQKYALSKAVDILNSNLFLEYVKNIGVISNGNSFRISPKDINNFMFPENLLW